MTRRAIRYHTLRSAYMQTIKWSLHRRHRKLVTPGTERELHYFYCTEMTLLNLLIIGKYCGM
jgi:hypothetical protein